MTPYFQIIPFLANLHETVIINTDLDVLRVKTDDHGNPHCHKQELTIVAGTLVSTRGHYSFQE